jgi:hypothetical protein
MLRPICYLFGHSYKQVNMDACSRCYMSGLEMMIRRAS